MKKEVVVVTPWFGRELKGGAEQQARQIAVRLAARGWSVEVLTTCCRSFFDDWGTNHLRPGLALEDGVPVRRFPVDRRRSRCFDRVNEHLLGLPPDFLKPGVSPVSAEASQVYCRENINSKALLRYLQRNSDSRRCFLFMPYLYGPVLNGLPLVADRAFLQPCLHDEPYAYLPQTARIFREAKGVLFNSEGEAELAARLYGPGVLPRSTVVGEGVEATADRASSADPFGGPGIFPERFVLYLGRRDATKNLDLLVRSYRGFRRRDPESPLKLVLAGPGRRSWSDAASGVVDLGLVSEEEKGALLADCLALFQPSTKESYSRVIMEAWLFRRPVAVHGDCPATATAVIRSGGGWLARDEEQWARLFAFVDGMPAEEGERLGERGCEYARSRADWEAAISRYEEILASDGASLAASRPSSRKSSRRGTVHQLLPNLTYGDAVSDCALSLRDHLRQRGHESRIFVRYLDPRMAREAEPFGPGKLKEADGLIYHHSIGSELTPRAVRHGGPKCLIYHNITPAHFFEPYRPDFAELLRKGRGELAELAPSFPVSAGVSEYNARELREYGFPQPVVLPIIVCPAKWNLPPDPAWMEGLADGRTNLLFVGRISPNKRQDQLVRAFSAYRRMEADARLLIVGNHDPYDPYHLHLRSIIEDLRLEDHVILTGTVSEAELQACYRKAHLFWSMSEHEGFGIPLVEAMWFDVPVLAFKSSAVPETLGDAAFMFTRKDDLSRVAALARLLVADESLRRKVVEAQRRRREDFLPRSVRPCFEKLLERMERSA